LWCGGGTHKDKAEVGLICCKRSTQIKITRGVECGNKEGGCYAAISKVVSIEKKGKGKKVGLANQSKKKRNCGKLPRPRR